MLQICLWVASYEVSGVVAAKLSWIDPASFVAMELDSHLLYFTKPSGKSLDANFLVGTPLNLPPEIQLQMYLEIWLWNIQGQGHEWGQRSRSHIIPSMQTIFFLFVSHQSNQPFLRYGQDSVKPWKNTSEIIKENLWKEHFPTTLLQTLIM